MLRFSNSARATSARCARSAGTKCGVAGLSVAVAILAGSCQAPRVSPGSQLGAGGGGGGRAGTALGGADGSADGSADRPLGPLAIDDETIDQAAGAALLDLARKVSLARGYAICDCLLPNLPNPPVLSADALEGCAEAESAVVSLFDPTQARCILEQSQAVPGFDAYLRCRTKGARDLGRAYASCPDGGMLSLTDAGVYCDPTTAPQGAIDLISGQLCKRSFYCADGTFTMTGRCDQKLDCPDGADERGCREFVCGDVLVSAALECDPENCPPTLPHPFCVASDPSRFLCDDGTEVDISLVCDGNPDCANGRDEQYCY